MSDPVALTVLALELDGVTAEQLGRRYAADVVVDFIGRRCVARDTAREIIAEHHAQRQQLADRRAEQLAESKRRGNPLRRRVQALQARQQIDVGGDLSRSALASMLLDDHDDHMAAADRRIAEYARPGDGYTMHSLTGADQ